MELAVVATIVGSFLIAVLLTGVVRKAALSRGLLDVPNERSSHTAATPVGGGLAIVLATSAGLAALTLFGALDVRLLILLSGGGGLIAFVGFLDDHRDLSVRSRFAAHVAAAAFAVVLLGGLPPLQIGDRTFDLGWAGYALGVLGIVWTLNLFNFMDGIDGLAASEATFVAVAGAALAVLVGSSSGVAHAAPVFGAACCGFLLWNWPPARIFMGDVGSGYAGYLIAVLALADARENPVALLSWVILGGAFFVDATLTLGIRVARGHSVAEAHRSHAYQRLARLLDSHRRVSIGVMLVNLLWLLPLAFAATRYPKWGAWIVLAALAPLVGAVALVGAGRNQR